MATWTTTGLQIDGVIDIREKLNQAGHKRFKNLLKDGEELRVDDASVIGRQYGIIAEMLADLEEKVFDGFANLDPTQASGQQLDDALNITTFKREKATGSTVPIMFHSVVNTTLNAGASVKSSVTGDVFQTASSIKFTQSACNGFQASIGTISPTTKYTIEYTVQGQTSNNAPISLVPTNNETQSAFLDRIVQTIIQQTSDLKAEKINDTTFSVYNVNRLAVCSFTLTNITLNSLYVLRWCSGVNGDEGEQDAFTVNIINGGSNANWISATNPYFSYGLLEDETDDEFRNRWKYYSSYFSYGNYDAMIVGLKAVEGVSYVNIQQNTTSNTDGDRVNNGISVILLGGNESDIAQAIFNKLPAGTVTNGTESGMAVDAYGNQHIMYFSRPSYVNMNIKLKIKTMPNFPQNGRNQIRQQLVDYFNTLEVGEDVYYSRLYNPINSVTGFSVDSLTIGVEGGALTQSDVTIKYNEIAIIDARNITIEV